MLYKFLKIKELRLLIILFCLVLFSKCVPIKKQLVLKDLSKKSLKEMRTVDTTLLYQPFEYKIKSNDVLAISLVSLAKGEYDLASLSQQGNISINNARGGGGGQQGGGITGYIVNDSGYVSFPVLGKLKVADLTLKQAQVLIQQKVDGILDNTTSNLRMLNYYVYVMGEVSTQGQIYAPTDRLTLLEAIALAGGFTDFSDRSNIKIIRNQNNQAHIYYVNLADQNFITKSQVYLLPNDFVVVEPYRAKVAKLYTIPNITLVVSSLALIMTLSFTLSNLLNRR